MLNKNKLPNFKDVRVNINEYEMRNKGQGQEERQKWSK